MSTADVGPGFSAASPFVVEVYPRVSVNADIESGQTTIEDDGMSYYDATR